MAPPNNPKVAKVAIVGKRDTRQIVNTLHVAAPDPLTSSDLEDIADEVYTWINTYYKGCFPSAYSFDTIQVRKLDPADPLALDYNISPPVAGTDLGTPEAGNVSATMSFRTGKAGRSYRGRMYIPGLGESKVSALDTLTSPQVVAMATAAAQLILGLGVGGRGMAIFHKLGWGFTPVTSFVIENIVDSMRRRLPGRGR